MSGASTILPKGFPIRRRGSCVPAAYLICKALSPCVIVQGYVGPNNDEHTWVERDGEIIDPTIRQFRWWRKDAEVSRREELRVDSADFVEKFERVISRRWWENEAAQHFRKILSAAEVYLEFPEK